MNKKRLISFLAAAAMLALTACGDSEDSSKSKSKKDKADSSSVVESESGSSSTDEGTTDAVTNSSSEDIPADSEQEADSQALGKDLTLDDFEELVKQSKSLDYESGKAYFESAFKNFLYEVDLGDINSEFYDELEQSARAFGYYPTSEVSDRDSITGRAHFHINFHYTDSEDTVPTLLGRELTNVSLDKNTDGSISSVSFVYGFDQYSKANGNTGNLYGKTYKSDASVGNPEMTDIFEHKPDGEYDGSELRRKINIDNFKEIVSALTDAYGIPTVESDDSDVFFKGDAFDEKALENLDSIANLSSMLNIFWDNTPVGKVSISGLFSSGLSDTDLIILTAENA
ncbi:MAG: hypothetical protein J6O40_01190 [Ruminococcus sp.]|nr:hypothetical protein [Ruminococcus sp.]